MSEPKILPILGYGLPVLRKKADPIPEEFDDLDTLIENMFATMYNAKGVGLAGPQVGLSRRIFIVDTRPMYPKDQQDNAVRMAFVNPQILDRTGELESYEEGCLSIPNVHGDVDRPPTVRIRYQDSSFAWHEKEFEGPTARVIQHEYDHIEGVLFTSYLGPIKKRRIRRKLDKIRKGKINVDYPMKFAKHS